MPDSRQKIIIVGAGLVGTSLALSLKDQAFDIEIFETHLPDILTNNKADSRPISLSYGSHLLLKSLGVWDSLEQHACPIKTVHVSELGQFGCTHITAKEQKVPALGFVVPFGQLQSAIYHLVTQLPNVSITPIIAIDQITTNDTGVVLQVTTSKGSLEKSADLLVAADGTQSTCRKLLSIATQIENKGDNAWIFELDLTSPHDHTAYERFTPHGVLAVLPLHNPRKARLVWSVSKIHEKEIADWTQEQQLLFLQNSFEGRIAITNIHKTAQFPLQTVLAETQIRPSAVLLGNAAHTIYPVAAQGFNLGLCDVVALTNTLSEATQNKEKIGEKAVLNRYLENAKPHQEAIIQLTNRLTPLFELQLPFSGCARGLGLLAVDLISPLKSKLAKRTMGLINQTLSFRRKH